MKANKIIEMSQEKSRQKVKLAMDEIQRMRNEGERITVSGLCKRTGLSNSFFYRNPKIKEEVHKAVDIQNQRHRSKRWMRSPAIMGISLRRKLPII